MKHIILIILFTSALFSQDVLKLKNGKIYEGQYFGERDGTIIFKIKGESSTKTFSTKEIESVGKKDSQQSFNTQKSKYDVLTLKNGKVYEGQFFGKTGNSIVFKRKNKSSTEKFTFNETENLLAKSGVELLLKPEHRVYFYSGFIEEGLFDEKFLKSDKLKFKQFGKAEWTMINPNKVKSIQTLNGNEIFPFYVANSKSGIYHLSYVRHLPEKNDQKLFENIKHVKNSGFKPCTACFDNRPTITDFHLERSLVRSTIIEFQNNNEILYEHKDFQNLMEMLDKVLGGWPNELKGYDYRIQIYRDSKPNALAIGGGNLYISSGLLDLTESDLELESVVAHEVAHVERRHTLRQFYENQKNKSNAALASIIVGVGVIAAGGDAVDVATATTITTAIGDYATHLASKGYSRELEEEADIMAQLYIAEHGGNYSSMISVLDKFATSSIVKGDLLTESVNAFSSHPSLLKRIKQVESAELFNYENPLIITIKPIIEKSIESGSVVLEINNIYKAHSSLKENMDMFYLIGSINNTHPEWSFKLNELKFRLPGSNSQMQLDGIRGKTVLSGGDVDFSGVLYWFQIIKFKPERWCLQNEVFT